MYFKCLIMYVQYIVYTRPSLKFRFKNTGVRTVGVGGGVDWAALDIQRHSAV